MISTFWWSQPSLWVLLRCPRDNQYQMNFRRLCWRQMIYTVIFSYWFFFNVLYFSFNDTEIYSPLELGACFSNRQTLAHVFIYIYEQQYSCFIVFQYATEWQSSSTHLSFFLSLILMAVFFLLIWWICIEKLDEKFLDQTKFSCNYGFIVPLNFQCFFMFFNR